MSGESLFPPDPVIRRPEMTCAGCQRKLEVGDLYIEDTPSGFMKTETDDTDGLMVELLGGSGGKIRYCEDCCQDGGDYYWETVYEEKKSRPRPDFDPHIDYPERFKEGPI